MARLTKKTSAEVPNVPRGWGKELWIENLPDYCGKVLLLRNGEKCSMHFHMKKLETMYLQDGRVDIDMIDPATAEKYTVCLEPGDSVRIERGQPHQIVALKDSTLIEFSTKHEEEDSYKIWRGSIL